MTLGVTGQTATMPATATAATAATAAPAAAPVNPLAAFTTRVKRIDPNELLAVVQAYQAAYAAETAAAGVSGPSDAGAGAAVAAQTGQVATPSATSQQIAAAQALAAAQAQAQAEAQAVAKAEADRVAAAAAAAKAQAATPTASSSLAPRTANDFWTDHIAQFRGKYLPDGPTMRPNCGPASVTMALRMIGLDIPGFNGQNSEAVLDKARIIGTGTNDTTVGTTDSELEKIVTASGGRWSESNSLSEMLGWVDQGIPVILAGNPSQAWNKRYTNDQVYKFDGGHWVTVSGKDPATGFYIVNDPLSQIGPILVSQGELQTYMSSHGGLGIGVFR